MAINRRVFLKFLFKVGILSLIPHKAIAALNKVDCETTSDIEGPFYIPNSPNISILHPQSINSNLLLITGTVYANDCITPIPNAVIDVWHANKGEYNEEKDLYLNSDYETDFYRAKIYTDNNGNYAFQTVLPGKYLNGSYYRPSHIHYKSSYLDQNEITTQLYFENDSSIPIDPWASDPSATNRIIPLLMDENNNYNGVFDITLNTAPDDINNTSNSELRLINSISPNPIDETTYIYLNNHNNISIEILNINGIVLLKHQNIKQTKIHLYSLFKTPLKKGIYILKISTKQGHIESKRFTA